MYLGYKNNEEANFKLLKDLEEVADFVLENGNKSNKVVTTVSESLGFDFESTDKSMIVAHEEFFFDSIGTRINMYNNPEKIDELAKLLKQKKGVVQDVDVFEVRNMPKEAVNVF